MEIMGSVLGYDGCYNSETCPHDYLQAQASHAMNLALTAEIIISCEEKLVGPSK